MKIPLNYQDVVSDYELYLYFQKSKYASFESKSHKWEKGQYLYIEKIFKNFNRDITIADISCGDGVGLRCFKKMGFKNVTGIELNPLKIKMAISSGYRVFEGDFHNLKMLKDQEFDIVYSSHSLEHAYWPDKVLKEFYRILKPAGKLFVILPYPDLKNINSEAHGAKFEIGTTCQDEGQSIINFFSDRKFILQSKQMDSFREPEIWLEFTKDLN
jgi:ubiquinone/menaquinone biosynthesis C-methylase UbiE